MLTNNAREEAAPKSADLLLMECCVDCASLPEVEGSPAEHLMAACRLHGIVTGELARSPRQTHSSYAQYHAVLTGYHEALERVYTTVDCVGSGAHALAKL